MANEKIPKIPVKKKIVKVVIIDNLINFCT